jgi:hypothetical protein
MTEYVKSTNFASKDALAVGNPLKIVKGTEIDTEFNNIAVAVTTKADLLSPVFTGTPTAATATAGTTNTQLATTAFVATAVQTAVQIRLPLTTWTITETAGVLFFNVGGVAKAKLDGSGNLTVVGNVTAYGTV